MKKILVALMFVLLSFTIIACSKQQISTTEDVIKFIEEKGKDNVDWKDFEHLERLNDEEEVYDSVVNVYKLNDGSKLILTGNGYENKPFHINIVNEENQINIK